jgi:pantoate--beta-alanine ligase
MQVVNTIQDWKTIRNQLSADKTIGFVPTMGNLHKGHLSLIEQSVHDNDVTVLSIFINPTQFNNADDFNYYPKTIEADKLLAEKVKVDYLFCPAEQQMYPDSYHYKIMETQISQMMEGQYRPGHFDGMLTIVMKLLLLIKAHRAYIGEKDYQQLQLVRGLVEAFFLDTEIIACRTIREESGLPMSSRNSRFTPAQKHKAVLFPKIFHNALSCQQIKAQLIENGFSVDYIEDHSGRRFAAIKLDNIRLIDNFEVEK